MKFTKKIFFYLLLFSTSFVFCQSTLDEETFLKTVNNDSIFVEKSIELGILINISDPNKAEFHLKESLKKLDSNYTYSNKLAAKATTYDNLAIIERRKNHFDKALGYYLKALKTKEELKDSLNIGKSYNDIAKIFSSKREYKKAISYMKQALPLRKTDSSGYGISLRNYGKLLYLTNDYKSAKIMLDSAMLYLKTSPISTADVNTIYSKIYRNENKLIKALYLLNENLVIYSENEKTERKANVFIDMAIISQKLNKHNSALNYLDSARVIHEKINNKKVLSNIYLERYKIFNKQDNYKKALENYITHKKYNDSVFTIDQTKKVAQLELDFKQEKQTVVDKLNYEANEKHLITLTESYHKQKIFYTILLLLFLFIIIILIINYKDKQKIHVDKMRKKALESELLNEKMGFLQYKMNRLLADNKMRSDFKKDLIQKVKNLKKEVDNKNLIREYQSIIIQIENQTITEKRLDSTKREIDSKNSDFELKLVKNYPILTKSEREICLLINLNLSLKEIMNIRNVTLPSIKSARYRIRKKLEVPKGTELEFFIQNLFN